MNAKKNELEQTQTENPGRPEQDQTANASMLNPEQSMVFRLQENIDRRGRYSFRLGDMATGFSAGRNVSYASARQLIENSFAKHLGLSPQQYLDRHYEERRELGIETRRPQQRNGQDRSR